MPQADSYLALKSLQSAVHRRSAGSAEGILERIFTRLFTGLVYPQIWEDPVVDMRALELEPSSAW